MSTTGAQVRKQLRSTMRGTSVVEGAGTQQQQRAKGGEGGRRASTGSTATGGVRSPRTLVAVAKSLATASAGKVPSPAELFKLSGKQEASARQSAAQAQLRSGPARAAKRRSTVTGIVGDKAPPVVVEVPKHSVTQRQRRERELDQAAQARQLKQTILVERNILPPPLARTHSSHRPPGDQQRQLTPSDGQQQQQQMSRQYRPSLTATSRSTLTQVYGGKGRGQQQQQQQSNGRRSNNRSRSNQARQRCSRSLPPPKGRSTPPPNSASRRQDGRCTPFSEGSASPRNDLEGIPPSGKGWQRLARNWSPERPQVVRGKGRPSLRKRQRRATLAKAAASLRRTLSSTRSQTVLQEDGGGEQQDTLERRGIQEVVAGSQTATGSSPDRSNSSRDTPDSTCEELSPLITSISLSTSRMKEDSRTKKKRTVATNTSPMPRRRPPRVSIIGQQQHEEQQQQQAQPQHPPYSEVSNSLRDAARAHGLTITNLGGLRDSSLQQNSTMSPLHWSRASEEFLGTFCSAHGLTLVNMAHSFPSPSSPDTSMPPTATTTAAAASGWQNSHERPLRYPRPEPAVDVASPQDLVLVDRTAASVTTPGQGEEMSDYLEGYLRGPSMAPQPPQRPPLSLTSKPLPSTRATAAALPQRYAFEGPGRSRVQSPASSPASPPYAARESSFNNSDGMVDDVNDGMRIIDIITQLRSTTMEQASPAGVRTVSVPVQANLDQSSSSVPEAQQQPYHQPQQYSGLSGGAGDSGGLMLVDFNTQRRPPIRMTGNAVAAVPHRQGASTTSETSDILPESLYDSIGVSRLSDINDVTAKQQQAADDDDSRMPRSFAHFGDGDLLLEDICTKAEPVYSTSGSSSSLAGTATPSIPSGAASPTEPAGQWRGAWASPGYPGPSNPEELSQQARLALEHMDRTDELMRLADVADIHRRQQLLVRQQVADTVAAGRRHNDRLARAQELCQTMQASSIHARPMPPSAAAAAAAADKPPERMERSTETYQPPGRPVAVETAPMAMEAVGMQTDDLMDRRMEMELNLNHSLCCEEEGRAREDKIPLRGVRWTDSHGYAMWTQTDGPTRGVDQGVQPSPTPSSCRSNERWSVATSRGGGTAGDSGRRGVGGVCCSSSSPSYSMIGFEEDEDYEKDMTASEVSMVHPGSIVASSFQSDISLPFTAPYSDWRSSAAAVAGGGGGQRTAREGDEEASILSASAALEGHLNLTYRSLRNDRSIQASPGSHDVTLRSSLTSLCESRLSQSPSCSSSMVTDLSFDVGRHSVEEVTGALARRRKRAVEDVEKRIRDSKEKMATGKEKDIPSPIKKRRQRRELRRRRRRETSRSLGSLRDSRESTGSSTDSLSIIIRDAERRLLYQQQRLRSRGEAVAKATEDAIRENEAKLKRVEYLKELKEEIAVARREISPPPVEASKEESGPQSAPSVVKEVGEEVIEEVHLEDSIEERPIEGDVEELPEKQQQQDELSPRIRKDDDMMAASSDDERKSTASSGVQRIHAVEVHNEEDSSNSSTKLLEVVQSLPSPEATPTTGGGGLIQIYEKEADILREEEASQASSDSAVLIADPLEAAKAVAEAKAPSLRKEAGGGPTTSGGASAGTVSHQFETSTGPVIEVARFDAKSPVVVTKESAEDLEIDKMEVVEEAPVQSPELITILPTRQQHTAPTSGSSKTSPVLRTDADRMMDSSSPSAGTRALLTWVRALPKPDLDECVNHITEHVLESLLDDRALERKVLISLGGSSSHPIEEGGSEESTRKLHADRLVDLKAQAAAVVEAASLRFPTTELVSMDEVNDIEIADDGKVFASPDTCSGLLWDSCLELARRPSPEHQECSLWCKRFPGAKSPLSPFIAVTNPWPTIQQQLNRMLEANSDLRMRAEAGVYHSELQQAEEQQVDNLARQAVSRMAIAGVTSLVDRSEKKLIRSRILEELDEAVFAALVEDFALELRDEYEEGGG